MALATLSIDLVAKLANFERDMGLAVRVAEKNSSQISAAFGGIKTALGGLAAFASADFLIGYTKSAMAYSDAISDTAKANDMAVSSVMGLSSALSLNGGKADDAGKFIQSFSNKLDDAANGSKEARDGFARIGISLRDIGSKSTQDLMDQALGKLSQMEDAATRNSAAQFAFGKAAKGVDFKELGSAYGESAESMKEYSKAIAIAADIQDKLEQKSTKTMVMFTNAFIPTLNATYDELNKGGGYFETFFGLASESFQGIVIAAKFALDGVAGFIETIKTGVLQLNSLLTLDMDSVKKYGKDYVSYMDQQYQERLAFFEKLKQLNEKGNKEPPVPTVGRDLKADKSFYAIEEIIVGARNTIQKEQDKIQLALSTTFESEQQKKLANDIQKVTDAVRDRQEQIYKMLRKGDISPTDAELAQTRLNEIQLLGIERATALNNKQQELNYTFEYGATKAVSSYINEVNNLAKQVEDTVGRAFKGIEDVMVTAFTTGKLSFTNMANSIISDMARIVIRQNITGPLAGLLGSAFSGNRAGGAAPVTDYSSAWSPGVTQANGGAWINGIQAFANGGAFTNSIVSSPTLFKFAKGTGLMGEAGPEAILPLSRNSRGQLGVASSGGGVNIVINNQAAPDGYEAVASAKQNDAGMNIEVMVRKAVSNDLSANGPMAQQMSNVFGLRRSI